MEISRAYFWYVVTIICGVAVLWWAIVFMSSMANAESGVASVYGRGDGYAGRKTASGERMNPRELTAAHKTLPFGSRVTVTNYANGRQVEVRINDRGPFVRGRIVDLTPKAAWFLGCRGLCQVAVTR